MTTDQPAAPHAGLLGLAPTSRERAYASARRHSGRVRFLKVAIPIGAAGAAALVLLATLFNPFGQIPGLTLGPLSLVGSKVAMENPKLTGFRKDARPYEVTAAAAFQDVRKPGVIELKEMRAKLAAGTGQVGADLVSALGIFDTGKETLELKEDIRVTTSRGEEVLLRSAFVDFKGGTMVSREPLKLTTRNGSIEAEGVQVSDSGHTISFTGRVRTIFLRPVPEPATTATTAGTPPAPARPSSRISQADQPAVR